MAMPKRLLLAASLLVALFCLAWPMYVIRPFRGQGPAELDSALLVLRWRPYLLAACLVTSLLAAKSAWPKTRLRQAALAAVPLTVALAFGLSRVNVFEIMFHRIDVPTFEPAAQTTLAPDDKVLAITANGAARAYPVRALAYHHIVNDTLADVPIVGTY